jgi:hypothetical protein
VRGDEAVAIVITDQLTFPLTVEGKAPGGSKFLIEGGGQVDDYARE